MGCDPHPSSTRRSVSQPKRYTRAQPRTTVPRFTRRDPFGSGGEDIRRLRGTSPAQADPNQRNSCTIHTRGEGLGQVIKYYYKNIHHHSLSKVRARLYQTVCCCCCAYQKGQIFYESVWTLGCLEKIVRVSQRTIYSFNSKYCSGQQWDGLYSCSHGQSPASCSRSPIVHHLG